ncbi:hypothetical protein [Mycoplasma sp. MV126]|uniref:hypothetical protein n=1 Tax=Mycoplasma sp. MV126 TaxID=3401676 RepID=UPI003AAF4AC0
MTRINKIFLTLGSASALILPASLVACNYEDVHKKLLSELESGKDVKFKNKAELVKTLELNWHTMDDKYRDEFQDKIALNQAVLAQDFLFLKNGLRIFNKIIQSDLIANEREDINFTISVSYEDLSNYLSSDEYAQLDTSNENDPYNASQEVAVYETIQDILAGKITSVTRFQWAMICEYLGEAIDVLNPNHSN